MMNIIFRSSLFSLYSKYILPSYRNCLTDLSPRYHSLSHPYIQQCKRRFFIVFFPDYFSQQNEKKFYWEWFFILLRTILRATASDFMPCATSPTHTMRLNEKKGSHPSYYLWFNPLRWTFFLTAFTCPSRTPKFQAYVLKRGIHPNRIKIKQPHSIEFGSFCL